MKAAAFSNTLVAAAYAAFPDAARRQLLLLRTLILETASNTEGVGILEETLKWGEPAYLTSVSKSGSTIRLGWNNKHPQQVAMYFNCKTTLVERFRTAFAKDFKFEGNRALLLEIEQPLLVDELRLCVHAALTYHCKKSP